jgi:hypothetical protein
VLACCALVDEGLDVPEAGCLQLVRPTKSLRLLRQLQGRVLRPAPGKERALLIDHGPSWRELPPPCEEISWSLDPDTVATAKGVKTVAVRSVDGRVEIVAVQRPEVELRQITPEEAALQRAVHNAEQLRKVLWLHERGRVPNGAVLSVLNRAPRTLEEFEAAAKTLHFGRTWAALAFSKQKQRAHRQQGGEAPEGRRRTSGNWLENLADGFVTA